MSRLRTSTSAITLRYTILGLALAWTTFSVAAAGESDSTTQADSGWQPTASRDYSVQKSAASQWAPVRGRARTNQLSAPADSPINDEADSASLDVDDDSAATTPSSRANQSSAPVNKNKSVAPRQGRNQTAANAVRSNQHTSNSRWQLPNDSPSESSAVQTASDPSRTNASNASREPRPFTPPTNVAKMTAKASANPRGSTTQQASANRQTTNNTTINQPTNNVQRPYTPPSSVRSNNSPMAPSAPRYRVAERTAFSAKTPNSAGGRIWDTINVAFQSPEEWTEQPDNLPLPGGGNGDQGRAPMMPSPSYMTDDVQYYVGNPGGCSGGNCECQGGPGGCSDGMCGCGPTCGCGESCDPSCGCGCGDSCEPGCGCPNGGCEDLCCIGCGDDQSCHTVRMRIPKWQELMLIGGVQGFKNPYDRDRDSGNFGFHEGFNIGAKLPFTTLGYQIGYQAVHSQLNGDKDTNISDPHTQQFVTAGIFKREKNGVQFGVVWDTLRDERWGAVDFHQLRGELSFIENGCHEIGFALTSHLNDHELFIDSNSGGTLYQASDQYLLFYRFHGCRGGEGRIFGGFNDDSDGVIGADMLLPLQDRWSLQAGFTYLIPDSDAGFHGASQEAWNIGLGLVWHFDCRARKCHSNCYRPMFNVADNGYLIVDDRPGQAPPVVQE